MRVIQLIHFFLIFLALLSASTYLSRTWKSTHSSHIIITDVDRQIFPNLQKDDVILTLNDENVRDPHYISALFKHGRPREYSVGVVRNKIKQNIPVVLSEEYPRENTVSLELSLKQGSVFTVYSALYSALTALSFIIFFGLIMKRLWANILMSVILFGELVTTLMSSVAQSREYFFILMVLLSAIWLVSLVPVLQLGKRKQS